MTTEAGQFDDPRASAPGDSWVRRTLADVAAWYALIARAPHTRAMSHAPWRSSPRLWWSAVALVAIILATMLTLDVWAVTGARELSPRMIETFETITEYGKSGWFLWPLGVLLLAALTVQRSRLGPIARSAFTAIAVRLTFLFLAIALPGLFAAIVKQLIGRGRPFVPDNVADAFLYQPFTWSAPFASLPSGHSTTAFATLIAFGALWPVLRPLLWIYALLIGLSRVVVTAHHPSDVIAGAAVGVVGALLVRDWFAARRLAFTVSDDGHVRPMPGPRIWRVGRLIREIAAGYRTAFMAAKA